VGAGTVSAQAWDAWGGSWGASWGASWGFVETLGGGGHGGSKRAKLNKLRSKKGWANERAATEASIEIPLMRQAQAVLRKAGDAQASRIAAKINSYDAGAIDIDAIRIEHEALMARLKANDEMSAGMREAREMLRAFIDDEAEAIDALMEDFEADIQIVLQSFKK
jgi:hypothetical protein